MRDTLAVWDGFLSEFAGAFTRPSLVLWQLLISGWVLCAGRRTVTRILSVIDPGGHHAHDAYHRLLRAGQWKMSDLWRILSQYLVSHWCPTALLFLDLDDTLFHRSGRKVEGAGVFRDAVRSTKKQIVYALGLNLVVLTLRVTPPWTGIALGLPINLRLHRKDGPTYLELAEAMMAELATWFPDRCFELNADGAYASLAGKPLPRTRFTSRMRSDAALFKLPPPRQPGKRGRPPKKGRRLPTPRQMAKTQQGWQRSRVNLRGKWVERLLLCRLVLWYKVCPDRPVLLVIVQDPLGKESDDFFFTTCLQATGEEVACQYANRWSIEVTFRDVKQDLGGEDPQTWKGQGPERAAALAFWLYSSLWSWYLSTHGSQPSWILRPWYPAKATPSFTDALASLRRDLWHFRVFSTSHQKPLPIEKIDYLINLLATAA
jgi:hypothetical protein